MNTTMVEVIPYDAIIEIKLSGGFYGMIQEIAKFLITNKNNEELQSAMEQLKTQNFTDDWVKHYQTLLILCKEIEKEANAQGKHTQMPLDQLM
jgi:hypothetical protein